MAPTWPLSPLGGGMARSCFTWSRIVGMTVARTKSSTWASFSFWPAGSLENTSADAAFRSRFPFWQTVLAWAR